MVNVMDTVPVWGPGPFDNVYALQAAEQLTDPATLRSELAEALHALQMQPGSAQYRGYAAAESIAAAGASHPYWQSEVPQHPRADPDRPETGYSFFVAPQIDEWIRKSRPKIPLEIVVDAIELVGELLQQADVWQDPEARTWYLSTTALHLDTALAKAEAELEIVTEVDDVF